MSHDAELAVSPALPYEPQADLATEWWIRTLVVLTSGLCWTQKCGKV